MNGHSPQSKRRLKAASFIVAAAAIAGGVSWLALSDGGEGRYSRSNYEKIRDGMTIGEVQALLGAPGKDASQDAWRTYKRTTLSESPETFVGWRAPSGTGYIVVGFDRDGHVCGKSMFEPNP